MNQEMYQRLSTYANGDEMISIYYDFDNPDTFTLGYLLGIDENNVLVNRVDRYGEENGFCVINSDNIYNFEQDKMYIEKIETLFNLKQQKRKYISNPTGNPMENFLKDASDNHWLIQVNEDDYYIGYVQEFSDQVLTTEKIDNYGDRIGVASLDMDHVNSLKSKTRYLKDLEMICKYK